MTENRTTNSAVLEICLASTLQNEFEQNIHAMAFMRPNDVSLVVEGGVCEAMSFVDMLKIGIAQSEAKLAMQKAARLQVELALESVLSADAKH